MQGKPKTKPSQKSCHLHRIVEHILAHAAQKFLVHGRLESIHIKAHFASQQRHAIGSLFSPRAPTSPRLIFATLTFPINRVRRIFSR